MGIFKTPKYPGEMHRWPGEGKCEADCLTYCNKCEHLDDECKAFSKGNIACQICPCYGCDKEED